jgi:hypothetical protein
VYNKPEVIKELNRLHEEYVFVLGDNACNNIVFICKAPYYHCIIKELKITSTISNRIYTSTTFCKDEILQKHASILSTLNITCHVDDDYEWTYLYWIPKLHKTPRKQRCIAGSKTAVRNLYQCSLQKY